MPAYDSLSADQLQKITTLGALKKSGYQPRSVKTELRDNLIKKLQSGEDVFPGIFGYEETVIPEH